MSTGWEAPSLRWQARWIWCAAPDIVPGPGGMPVHAEGALPRTALFRRAVDLDVVPERAPARIVADGRYVLWVNGVEAMRGPVRGNPRRLRCDVVDLAPFLVAGDNLLALMARWYCDATAWWMPAPPSYALGGGAVALEARLPGGVLGTDSSWRTLDGAAWRPSAVHGIGGAPPEVVDGRLVPSGWQRPGFDDGGWAAATELSGAHVGTVGDPRPPHHPFGALAPSPLPARGGARRAARVARVVLVGGGDPIDDPVLQVDADERTAVSAERGAGDEIAAGGVTLVTMDFGEQVSGTVLLDVDAPPGTRLDVAVAEGLGADGRLERLQQHAGFGYIARGHDDRFETLDPIGFRFARVAVRPAGGPVRLRPLVVQERLFPRPAGPFFTCSDPVLDRIWSVGRRTVDLCSHDAYLDCPSREQRAWTGDAVVHQQVDLATNPDWRLARWHPLMTASPRPDGMLPMAVSGDMEARDAIVIPDWALHWVRSVHNLWRYCGDREEVAALLGPAEGVLRWFLPFQRDDGLLHDVTGWVLIDWAAVHVAGASSVLNGLYGRALRDFAEMAEWLGDAGRAAWARRVRERLRAGFERFWDAGRGLYVDHVVDGAARRPVSQHGNAAAICAGFVSPERLPMVVAALVDRERLVHASWLMPGGDDGSGDMYRGVAYLLAGPAEPWWDVDRQVVAAQPFFRSVVHDAVAEAGRADLIADLCRDWTRLLARCGTSWSETWEGGSRCHGWSSTPTRDLVVRVLGIEPAEPGFAVARVAPHPGDLAEARGAAPTPHGLVTVTVTPDVLEIDSPIPVDAVVRAGAAVARLAAGRHRLDR